MAYQAKRHKRFQEDFELVNEEGEVIHSLHVDLDADDLVPRLNRKYTELIRALADTSEAKQGKITSSEDADQRFERLGHAVVDMLEAVFGEEDTALILDFYDNRYIELTKEVVPFITKCVIPRCIEIRKENQQSILNTYNRKQRRAFLKGMKH